MLCATCALVPDAGVHQTVEECSRVLTKWNDGTPSPCQHPAEHHAYVAPPPAITLTKERLSELLYAHKAYDPYEPCALDVTTTVEGIWEEATHAPTA